MSHHHDFDWIDYKLYKLSEALADWLTIRPPEETKTKNEENNSDESSDKRSQWIAVIVIWLFAFVAIAIRFSL